MKASIIVATHNRAGILEKTLTAMLVQDFDDFEIIAVNDCSKDNTKGVLKKFKAVRAINLEKQSGPAGARNTGIREAKGQIIVIMDDDCIPEKGWLSGLVNPFSDKRVGIASSFDHIGGGTSTAFRKEALDKTGLFDENFKYPFREDTDLVFRILDEGYTSVKAHGKFEHLHKMPEGFSAKIRYAFKRVKYHSADNLLYKKHPKRAREFLKIRWGFLVSPGSDFNKATGRWQGGFDLSSPQGIKFLANKTPLHAAAIALGGILYVMLVKTARLFGSLRHKKLLI